jgi:hypothetical protein
LVTAQKDTPAPAAPWSSQQNRGFLRREDYYTSTQVATKKREKRAILLGEIDSTRNPSSASAAICYPLVGC